MRALSLCFKYISPLLFLAGFSVFAQEQKPQRCDQTEIVLEGRINAIDVSDANQLIALLSGYGLHLCDIATFDYFKTFDGVGGYSLVWSPDGSILAIGSNKIQLWDVKQEGIINELIGEGDIPVDDDGDGHTGPPLYVFSMAWSPDGKRLASIGTSNLRVWNIATSEIEFQDETQAQSEVSGSMYPNALAWSPDGNYFIFTDHENMIVWDTSNWEVVQEIITLSREGNAAWSNTNLLAVSKREIEIWDTAIWKKLDLIESLQGNGAISWSPDDSQLAIGQQHIDGTYNISILNVLSMKTITGFPTNNRLWDITWTPDGEHLIVLSEDGSVQSWDVETQELVAEIIPSS